MGSNVIICKVRKYELNRTMLSKVSLTTLRTVINCHMRPSMHIIRLFANNGAWWRIGRFETFRPKGREFESRSIRHVGTLAKSFTCSGLKTPAQYPCCVGSASE